MNSVWLKIKKLYIYFTVKLLAYIFTYNNILKSKYKTMMPLLHFKA